MTSSIGMDLVRGVFAAIDRGVYRLIGILYTYIEKIAGHQLFDQGVINNISNKLYSFVAIFMLFKISFSLINYIINPDSIVDKEKGGSKLIVNILITFGLIIVAPFGFNLLYEAQTAILEEHLISNIFISDAPTTSKTLYISNYCKDYGYPPIMPATKYDATTLDAIYNEGEYIALMTLRPFVQVDDAAMSVRGEETVKKFLSTYCSRMNINSLMTNSIVNFDNSTQKVLYIMDYNILLSSIIGIIVALLFAGFCLDAALRTIKLYFLQIIAPIPIMSYIDPSSSKKGLFSKWLKEVGITWADLFLRLASVYFAIFIISNLEVNTSDGIMNILLILGTLMFAKKLPDILKKMFNIDVKGDFKLNPLKKFQEQAFGGKQIMGAATGLAAGTLGMATSFRGNNFKERFANAGKGFTSGLKGGYKSPTTIKGLGTGMQPYKEIKKKQKEADKQLKQFDDFEKKGQKLVKKALSSSSVELTSDGKKYDIDEAKAKLFNNEYRESYMDVQTTKKKLKDAKEESKSANSELQRIVSGNLTDSEKEAIKSKSTTYEDLKNNASKFASEKDASVEKLQNVLSSKKERHKIVQQKYPADAELENAMEEYLNRNPNALNVNVDHAEIKNQSSYDGNSNSSIPNPAQQSTSRNKYDETNKNPNSGTNANTEEKTEDLSPMEQAINAAQEDLENGVDQVYEEGDFASETTINGMTADEYNKSMAGDETAIRRIKKVINKIEDKITEDKIPDEVNYHTSHINDETNSHYDEDGHFNMSSNDMYEEALRRSEEQRNKKTQEESNTLNNFFRAFRDKNKR